MNNAEDLNRQACHLYSRDFTKMQIQIRRLRNKETDMTLS